MHLLKFDILITNPPWSIDVNYEIKVFLSIIFNAVFELSQTYGSRVSGRHAIFNAML